MKVGLAERAQLNVQASVIHGTPVSRSTSLGDVTVGLKYRVLEHVRLLGDFALLPSMKFPTAFAREGFGTGTTDISLLLISSHELGPLEMDLNAGGTVRSGDGSQASRTATVWTASFGFPLLGAFGWVAEVFGYPGTAGVQGEKGSVALLVGPTFSAREWLALDLGTIAPVTGPQPRAVYAGFVWNIGSLSAGKAERNH
jgi:Putative MetA-pathway of phenol degradation